LLDFFLVVATSHPSSSTIFFGAGFLIYDLGGGALGSAPVGLV
jgi:hypothetical protein